MRFVLFVEGHTEQKALPSFLKRWLDPRLTQKVRITPVRFEGWRHYYEEIDKKVALNLSGKMGADVIAGIGLLDLYGPTFYPSEARTGAQRYTWGKDHIEKRVSHPKFRQHFAVHEAEAWLLAQPGNLPRRVASALPGATDRPESVNFEEPPSKLLDRLYWEKLGTAYKKVVDGSNLFRDLSPDVAYGICPYLKGLLDDMLSLARSVIS